MKQTFSSAIKDLRERQGKTLREVGREANISPVTLNRFERGMYNPKISTIVRLAVWAGVPPAVALQQVALDLGEI